MGPTSRPGAAIALVALVVTLLLPVAANGADRLYWANFGAPERISFANTDGSGGIDLNTGGSGIKIPIGLALDPSSGRAYWSNESAEGKISFTNLDGSPGAGILQTGAANIKGPSGVAIDPVQRRIYWGNIGDSTISWANLDSPFGGGELNPGPASINGPYELEVDTISRRLYWTNASGPAISWAYLDGSGGADVPITGPVTMDSPFGLAIDPTEGKIYWANSTLNGRISYANLDGGGGADLNTAGATVSEPVGVAVDPERNRVYWANRSGGLSFADTNGGGGANIKFAPGFASGTPNSPNLLASPRPLGAPSVSGPAKPGGKLSCGTGDWAADIVSASFYATPTSFAYVWSRSGKAVAGTNGATVITQGVAEYRCTVTATNPSGSSAQTSKIAAVFKIGKVKLDKRKGTAKLSVTLPGSGTLKVTGKGAKAAKKKVGGAKTVTVRIKAKGKAKRSLASKGKAKLKLKVSFSTSDGGVASQPKKIVLRKK